jgi:hypothetical protein
LENWGEFEIVVPIAHTSDSMRDVLEENPIKWVASASAGVTPYLIPELLESDILFTKA